MALGDSLTEGVGDPLPDGSLRGWADRLAHGLAQLAEDFEYLNLARRSLRTYEIRADQLPRALELKPDLSSALVGMNDLIRSDFDPDLFRVDLDSIVGELTRAGATVLMATFPDVSRFLPVPKRVRQPISERLEAASDAVRSVANDYPTILVDVWQLPDAQSRSIVSVDCMHPNERGHLLLARAFANALEQLAEEPITLPDPPAGRFLSRGTVLHLRWIARNAMPEALRFVRRLATRRF